MKHALTLDLAVTFFPDAEQAVKAGYVYRDPEYTGLKLVEAVVVRKGTVNGNSTVDLILTDESGKKFVTMVTGNLLKSIPA